jgi:hypothetical protein
VNDDLPDTGQRFTGRVGALFYPLDEPATTLTIQADGWTITARAFGQVALDSARCSVVRRSAPRCTMRHPTIRRSSPSPSSPGDEIDDRNTQRGGRSFKIRPRVRLEPDAFTLSSATAAASHPSWSNNRRRNDADSGVGRTRRASSV